VELKFLGVSSALSVGYKIFQSNMIIKSLSDKYLLIDCGTDIKHSLNEQNIQSSDIDAVYISHLHSDHTGGLEWLGFSSLFMKNKKKPKLYVDSLLEKTLWDNVLSGGMSSIEEEKASLATYFDVQKIVHDGFVWEGYKFELISVVHSMHNHRQLPCFGLIIHGDKKKVFLSTDTRFTPKNLITTYNNVDLIFHDCETIADPSMQHATYNDLKTLSPNIKAKMWLYDYNDINEFNATQDGFLGFVIQGQKFDI
jgi:ribonuclease BN (tRNA processing enzyme)